MPGEFNSTFVSAAVRACILTCAVASGVETPVGHAQATPETAAAAREQTFQQHLRPLVESFCVECHSQGDAMADIVLNPDLSAEEILNDRPTWERVFRMLNANAMPPHDHSPRPTPEQREAALAWLQDALFDFDCEQVGEPARPTLRRLNRAEYNNTIRDLVGIDLRPADDFPADGVGHGFDNMGEVLSLSPLLIERYLRAAEAVAEAAILEAEPSALKSRIYRQVASQLKNRGGVQFGDHDFHIMYSHGVVFGDFTLPVTGQYVLRVEAAADQAGPELAKLQLRLDGDPREVIEIPKHREFDTFELRGRLSRGTHRLAVAFINDYYRPDSEDPDDRDRNVGVRALEIEGPTQAEPLEYPESHRRIIFTRPSWDLSPREAASQVIRRFASRAYRRPVTQQEVDRLVDLVKQSMKKRGASFEEGVRVAVQAILVSPHFLFRVESDPRAGETDPQADSGYRLNDFELASRLSYFLWSSMPDEQLFALARQDQLHEPATLESQVRRMLADEKSEALVANFAVQWLNLQLLEQFVPDPQRFEKFGDKLRADMRRETELLFETIMRENRSVLEFLTADYTFLNRRLARHYGRDDITDDQFVRASLASTPRRGVLTHASVLTLTSNPARTSPVKRGKWILENILGTPPPPPPADVPPLEQTAEAAPDLSVAEQLARHRESPACATCHRTMDPLGLSLENFDPIGRWREADDGRPIEAAGELPTGQRIDGAAQLVAFLNQREPQQQFCRTLTEKMLTYALGRGLRYDDRCAVDDVTTALAERGYRFHVLISEIVKTEAFLQRGVPAAPN